MKRIICNKLEYIEIINELESNWYTSKTDWVWDYYDDKFNNIIEIDEYSKEYNTIHRENPDTVLSNLTPEDLANTK
jgi:hypothetical protein